MYQYLHILFDTSLVHVLSTEVTFVKIKIQIIVQVLLLFMDNKTTVHGN